MTKKDWTALKAEFDVKCLEFDNLMSRYHRKMPSIEAALMDVHITCCDLYKLMNSEDIEKPEIFLQKIKKSKKSPINTTVKYYVGNQEKYSVPATLTLKGKKSLKKLEIPESFVPVYFGTATKHFDNPKTTVNPAILNNKYREDFNEVTLIAKVLLAVEAALKGE